MRRDIVYLLIALVAVGCAPLPTATPPTPVVATVSAATCHVNGALPDSGCTPGATLPVGTTELCVPGYSKNVRNVTQQEKDQVYSSYGITSHTAGEYEVDHLASLELGGSNAISNLWPQVRDSEAPNGLGFETKDKTENAAHDAVCGGRMVLSDVQTMIETNWVALCASLNVEPKCQSGSAVGLAK